MKRILIGLVAALVVMTAVVVIAMRSFRGKKSTDAGPGQSQAQGRGRPALVDEERSRDGEMNLLIDDDPAGNLRLEGIVLDAEDHPVGGAVVTVSSNPPRTAKSEEDGSFAFDKLVGRTYRLVAHADAGVAGPVTARLTATSDPVTLKLAPGGSVEVTVVGAADKRPVPGASVELRDLATFTATADQDGRVVFTGVAAGGWQLCAWAPGHGKTYRFVGVGRGAVVEHETIELRRGAPVAGVVRDSAGKPVAGALVAFAGVAEWNAQADPRRDAVTTGADGAFRFEAIPAGTFRFAARHRDYAPASSEQLTLDGQTERTGVDIVLEAGGSIAGKVVTKKGDPVPSAVVRVIARNAGWSIEDARQTFTDEAGAFEMKGLPRKQLDAVAVAEAGSSETTSIDLAAAAEKRDVVLTLELDGVIAGVVVDGANEPIPEAQVMAMPDLRGMRGARQAARFEWRLRGGMSPVRADAGGRFEITGLREGEYMVRATRPGKPVMRGMLREGTPAAVGDTNVKVVLESDGGVKGKVLLADGEAPALFVVGFGMGPGTPFSTEDGAFQLDDVPPGERTIVISGPSFDRKQVAVEVKSDEVADLGTITVTRGRSISGRVLTASGQPVAGASVTAARRLFGDGTTAGGGGGARGGGNPMAPRTATSGEDGSYTLYGVGVRELAIVAEHDAHGRSTTINVPGTPDPVTLDLVLQPFCSLSGVITKAGAPADGIMVNVTSQTVPNTNFIVATGPDGAFRFDRLAPDTYLVQATEGSNPLSGLSFHTKIVTLAPGQSQSVKIDVGAYPGSILVSITRTGGGVVRVAEVHTIPGSVAAKNAREMELEAAALGGRAGFTAALAGLPAEVMNLAPGTYSVCVVPYPEELRGPQEMFAYREREGDNMPIFCAKAQVAGAQVPLTIEVTVPAFVPPPPGESTLPSRRG